MALLPLASKTSQGPWYAKKKLGKNLNKISVTTYSLVYFFIFHLEHSNFTINEYSIWLVLHKIYCVYFTVVLLGNKIIEKRIILLLIRDQGSYSQNIYIYKKLMGFILKIY